MSGSRRWVVLMVGLLAACGDEGSPASAPADDAAATTTATSDVTAGSSSTVDPAPPELTGREPYSDCGDDHSLELDPLGPPSVARRCLLAANSAAKPAELISYERGTSPSAPPFSVYRTNADRTVDVFVPAAGAGDGPWQLIRCAGLAADERRVFELVGCSQPVDVD